MKDALGTARNAVDFKNEVDYDYYIAEAKKLIVGTVEAEAVLSTEDTQGED